jgi:hypothetical protein
MGHYSSDCMVSLIVELPLSVLMCTSCGTANLKKTWIILILGLIWELHFSIKFVFSHVKMN